MKRLIVNADDLGADEGRNDGIFEAIEAGVVTSVSILPNGPSLRNALSKLRSLPRGKISCGIHINLSEGTPLSSGLRLVTGPDGRFRGKQSARHLLLRRGDPVLEREIRRELEAQICALRDAGVAIDHLDGHQHVHVFPAVARLAAEGAKNHEIPWIRIPEEPLNELRTTSVPTSEIEEGLWFSGHAEAARPLVYAMGISATDYFRGLYLKGNLPAERWEEYLETLPHGLTEFMVHPGRFGGGPGFGPFSSFSTPAREMELAALTDGRFQLALQKTGVELTPFPEAAI